MFRQAVLIPIAWECLDWWLSVRRRRPGARPAHIGVQGAETLRRLEMAGPTVLLTLRIPATTVSV